MSDEVWTIRRVLAWGTDDLRKRGFHSPRLDVELLLAEVLGVDRVRLIIDADRPLSKEELHRYREMHQRRRSSEPVAYLLGRREFYGRVFRVDRRVLIPRPETELLVETGLRRTKECSLSIRTLDLCTGSGCVATTIACERPTAQVLGADISEDALSVARDNALRLGAVNVGFVCSDLFSAFDPDRAAYDLIVANPPYIEIADKQNLDADIRDFEPHLALFGGEDGLSLVRRLVADAPRFLEPNGILAIEIGSGQAEMVENLFAQSGFFAIERTKDYGGHERIVSGMLPGG